MSPEKRRRPTLMVLLRSKELKSVQIAGRVVLESVFPIALGILCTIVVYLFILPLFPHSEIFTWVREKLQDRGPIPYICTILLFWHISHVLVRLRIRILPEFRAFKEDLLAGDGEFKPGDIEKLDRHTREVDQRRGGTLLTRRIMLAINHLQIRWETEELGALLQRRSDADYQRVENGYAMPNFLFWAIPILGFVGTVLGIGLAVTSLKSSLGGMGEGGDVNAIISQVAEISSGLGIAFDTTLVALVMSVAALLVQTLVYQQEMRLHSDIDDYLTYRLISRIRPESVLERFEVVMRRTLEDMQELQTRTQASNEKAIGRLADVSDTLASARDAIVEGIGLQSETVLVRASKSFREAVTPLADAMRSVAQEFGAAMQDGEQIVSLQSALRDNLDQLVRIGRIDETFMGIQQSLDSLQPVMAKLSGPIPLRFTVGSLDLPLEQVSGRGGDGAGNPAPEAAGGEGEPAAESAPNRAAGSSGTGKGPEQG